MKQYGVIHKLTGVTVAGPYDGLTQAHSVAKSFGGDFATVTWVGFFGLPAMACVMRQVGDVLVLETACLYKAKAEQLCREFGGEEEGFRVVDVMLNYDYPHGGDDVC